MNHITMNGYTRISKAEARKRFCAGKQILIVPCKCRPNDKFWGGSYITDVNHEREVFCLHEEAPDDFLFENIVGMFTYYNCQYNETGKYPAYYKEV